MRYHLDVAKEIQKALPEELKEKMNWILNDLSYKAPEEKLGWDRLMSKVYEITGLEVNENYEPINPEVLLSDDWKIKVMSILSTIPEDKLREDIEKRVKAKPIVSELLND